MHRGLQLIRDLTLIITPGRSRHAGESGRIADGDSTIASIGRDLIRSGHADANFGIARRMVLSLLKNDTTPKVGMRSKHLIEGWNDDYLGQVFFRS